MVERLKFIELNQRKYFTHINSSSKANRKVILFLNPIFDEKKRVQKFQAETARALCCLGYTVIRFDYYGTGDSSGDTFEFSFDTFNSDFPYLIDYISGEISPEEIILLGVRLGADLAVINSSSKPDIKRLILIEPIIDGKRYLFEVRTRRKLFYSINKMNSNTVPILIHGQNYEDFQGYPMPYDNLTYLEELNLINYKVEDKRIIIFKTNSISNKKLVGKFKEEIEAKKACSIELHNVNCPEFWAALEVTDTNVLTQQIVTFISNN